MACAKGLWSGRAWHVGGTEEVLAWLKGSERVGELWEVR